MNSNTKLEIAKEVISSQIGKAVINLGLTLKDKELLNLIDLKDMGDRGNMKAIDHVLYVAKNKRGAING